MRALTVVLAALLVCTGCPTPNPKDTHDGYPGGWETPVTAAVQIKKEPRSDGDNSPTVLLAAVDTEVSKRLESQKDQLLADALKEYASERPADGTEIKADDCRVVVEDFAEAAQDQAALRKGFEGKVTKFRFTLRRNKARIVPDPTRVEAVVFCVERSWAPSDTHHFPQIFREKVMNLLTDSIYDVAKAQNLDPVERPKARAQ